MAWHARLVAGRYVDSIRLMAVAAVLREHAEVRGADALTGTAANLAALADRGVDVDAGPGDVILAVDADAATATAALDDAEAQLEADGASAEDGPATAPARTLPAAVRALGGAELALISVPGEHAALEAHRALSAGLHVLLFSDHVRLADELALKRRGRALGLLVMGPGCGTAMLGGVGLGFANVVPRGPVGIVAAAGTGAQEAAVLLADHDVGVAHIVGVGGRDLTADVGGIGFRQGLELLADDDDVETLLLVAKPSDPAVAAALGDVDVGGRRVVAAFLGSGGEPAPFEVHPTVEAAVLSVLGADPAPDAELAAAVDAAPRPADGRLLGLFSGGSLAAEATTVLTPGLGRLGDGPDDDGHVVVDLGEEEYTQGVPHPMVDLTTRLELLRERGGRDDVSCVLLDVVLGHGAHPDPAGALAPTLATLAADRVVLAHVCGTALDPQDAEAQRARLRDAGVLVAPTNAAAARLAARALGAATVGGPA